MPTQSKALLHNRGYSYAEKATGCITRIIVLVEGPCENFKRTNKLLGPEVWVKSEEDINNLDWTISRFCFNCTHLDQISLYSSIAGRAILDAATFKINQTESIYEIDINIDEGKTKRRDRQLPRIILSQGNVGIDQASAVVDH